ncbi:MAG: hypothetical protein IJB97_07980 [Clostridia bacterium]|nr:hypothetical protein [Clostridia bacterium]
MKTYEELALTIYRLDQKDIVCTSDGEFAGHDANDVTGDDPGFWEGML